jgi:WD40 repeat protein
MSKHAYSLVQAFTHQASSTSAVDFHSQSLAIGTREGVITIIDAEEGEISRTHHCFKYGVNHMRYFHSPDAAAVAAITEDVGSWRLWDLNANKFSAVFRGHDRGAVKNLEIHPIHDLAVSTCSETSVLWDVRSDKVVEKFNFRCPPVFEKSHGRFFVAAAKDGKFVNVFDIRNLEKPFIGFPLDAFIHEIAISADGGVLALAGDERVTTLDVNKGTVISRSSKLRSPRNLSFNWSGDLVAATTEVKEVALLKTAGLGKVQSINDHEGPAVGVFSPNRDLLVTASTGVGLWCPI